MEDLSDISCSFSMDRHQDLGTDVFVVSFTGAYGYGSLRNKDAAFMKAEVFRGMWTFDPDAVILDFRKLAYKWGDSLLGLFQAIGAHLSEPGEPPFPSTVATSDLCRSSLLSLTGQTEEQAAWHHRSIDAALSAANQSARAWLDT